jgi:hypothetical protein
VRLTAEQQRLVEDHLWIAEMPVREMTLMTEDERRASAYYALCKAAVKAPASSFAEYAQKAARRQIIQDWKSLRMVRWRPDLTPSDFKTLLPASAITCSTHSIVDDRDELWAAAMKIDRLNDVEKMVIIETLRGLRIKAIGLIIGKRDKTVVAIREEARRKLA